MAHDVNDWNINPNQRFFVRLEEDTVGNVGTFVDLYNTKADMDAETNRVAFATVPFGVVVPVTLTEDTTEPSAGEPLGFFNTDLSYHLKITGQVGDGITKLQVGPFTDLPPVEDALLVTEAMIQARATLELNRGTHSAFRRTVRLDKHYEALNEGDIVDLSSTKRGLVNEPNRIDDISIEVSVNEDGELSMFDVVNLTVFEDVVR